MILLFCSNHQPKAICSRNLKSESEKESLKEEEIKSEKYNLKKSYSSE
jgi:hypothetical protein